MTPPLKTQKYIGLSVLFLLNCLLGSTFIVFESQWYVFLFVLGVSTFLYACSSVLIVGQRMIAADEPTKHRTKSRNYMYLMPCYNESEQEITHTLGSLVAQQTVPGDTRSLMIMCDGIVQGQDNTETTDKILLRVLNIVTICDFFQYTTWDGLDNLLRVYKGIYKNTLPYILLIKFTNYGKRDSLVLARRLCFAYNQLCPTTRIISKDEPTLFGHILEDLHYIYHGQNIDYIIGTDADTEFAYECSYALIHGIEKDDNIHGCVGYVDIAPQMSAWHPFVVYQYAEYNVAQCLRRLAQSVLTKKVNCLSGCVQILRVSQETCGDEIMSAFNTLPIQSDILSHIRSYASEDRNHVCLMLSMYPHVKTTQALDAIAYTIVPTSWKVFLSQRRRWNLGANANDILLTYMPGINVFERISALINVMTFCLSPFINVATAVFLHSLITEPTTLMLYLSILMIIPFGYSLLVPIFIKPLSFRQSLYYYASRVFFLAITPFINTITFGYSLWNMDDLTWGKTRTLSIPSSCETLLNYDFTSECSSPTFCLDDEFHCPTLLNEEVNARKLSEFYFGELTTTTV